MLRTRLCDVLGIEYPILQAGMGRGTNPRLVAAVSNAGGLGSLGGLTRMTPDEIRENIREIKRLTKKPFGVDFAFPARAPRGAHEVPKIEKVPEPILQARQELREKGYNVPDMPEEMPESYENRMAKVHVALEEGVPVLEMALGADEAVVKEAHQRGSKVLCLAGRARHAMRHEANGADVVVATGMEAGGHAGTIPLILLVPQIVQAVSIPVAAAGGVVSGRQIASLLDLGAEGVWVGTRFLATPEASIPDDWKQRILRADEYTAVWSKAWDGLAHRHLWNRYQDLWKDREHEALPYPLQATATRTIWELAEKHSLTDYMMLSGGVGAALISDIKSAADVVKALVDETIEILKTRPNVKFA